MSKININKESFLNAKSHKEAEKTSENPLG